MSETASTPVRSPWGLFWRQLRRSPLAVAGGALLILLYGMALLAPFLAPYAESDIDRERFSPPPTPLHLRDAAGHWHARPFVYATRSGADQSYAVDRSVRYPLRLFARGARGTGRGAPCRRGGSAARRPPRRAGSGAADARTAPTANGPGCSPSHSWRMRGSAATSSTSATRLPAISTAEAMRTEPITRYWS